MAKYTAWPLECIVAIVQGVGSHQRQATLAILPHTGCLSQHRGRSESGKEMDP